MNRPLLLAAVSLVAGMLVAASGTVPGVFAPVLVCSALVAGAALLPERWFPRSVPVSLAFAVVGIALWNAHHTGPSGDALSRYLAQASPERAVFEGCVRGTSVPRDPGFTGFVVDVDTLEVNGVRMPLCGGLSVRWSQPAAHLYPGERVRIEGEPLLQLASVNPGVDGIEDVLRRRGINTAVRVWGSTAVERLAPAPWWLPTYWSTRLRDAQAERLAHVTPASILPFVLAVWLGDQGVVSPQEYEAYVRSGTAHILSISGLHVGILYATLTGLLPFRRPRRRLRAAIILAVLVLFALVAGGRAATLRAVIMIAFYLAYDFLDREPDALSTLSLAALVFLAIAPGLLLDVGFQLSFLSVASILFLGDVIANRLGNWYLPVRSGLATGIAAQVLTLPIAARQFHVIPLAAPFANLLVVPLLGVALWLILVANLLAWVLPTWASLVGYALVPIVGAIRGVSEAVASLRAASPSLTSPTFWAVGMYLCMAIVLWRLLKHGARRRLVVSFAIFVALVVATWSPWRMEPEVTFLDVGHGDAIFLRSPEGMTALVDGGDESNYTSAGSRIVKPFLWANHVHSLDYVFMSHPDRDHLGGLLPVLDAFRVGTFVIGPVNNAVPLLNEALERCERNGTTVRRVAQGDVIELGGMRVVVEHPVADWATGNSDNENSLVLRLVHNDTSVLLTGDIERAAEAALAQWAAPVTILKAPHHGSKTSSSQVFLDAFRPRYAVVSAGGLHGREPLSPLVLARYRAAGIDTLRTDLLGGICVSFDNNGEPCFESARMRRGYPVEQNK